MRISDRIRFPHAGKLTRLVYPLIAGMAVFFTYPSIIAYQDVASLSARPVEQRWLASIDEAPGETFATAAMAANEITRAESWNDMGVDPIVTGTSKPKPRTRDSEPDIREGVPGPRQPQKINRKLLGDRVVSATPVSPPVRFSAGSVMERQSMLAPENLENRFELAFVKAMKSDEAYKVASLFHKPKDAMPPIETDLPVLVASLVEESIPHVLAYGEQDDTLRSPFAAVLADERPISLIPKIDKDDHKWAATPLPLSTFAEREQNCLTAGIYFEARGEPVRGQAAVAQVILNRVKNPAYPNSICGVVYQNKEWRNRCQFSFACDRIRDRVNDPKRWETAQYVARETTEGRIWLTEVGSSTHYHATYVKPKWAAHMKRVGRIGLHIFYRTFGGGWS
ncbi:MAG: cell wall hydrolase [Nitratireductor sp.]